ncbi:hypothetical protein [Absidia glauca]|uniref:SURF1-like protein n=1 Tax=Absidia glauca TaxID=4829 RepID=A0A168T1K6_ABSGL|nr:hypothetical protein [Absidia glauca]
MLLHRLLPHLRPRPLMTCVPPSVPRTTALTTVWRRTLTTETSSTTSGSYTVKKRNETSLDDYEYRRVKVKGTFRHDQEMLVGPRTRGDGVVGYFLITPLQREDGSVILVKRGWVALDKKDKRNRPDSLVTGPVEVEGLLRLTEQPNSFTPDNDPEGNQWYWVDLDTMAELSYSQNLLVESVSDRPSYHDHALIEKGIPIGRSPVVEVRNSHMQYIITWYALSAATTVMLWMLLRKPPSRPTKIKRSVV